MKNARREQAGGAGPRRLGEMGERAGAARGDHRQADGGADSFKQSEIETRASAVPVHAGEQDLAGAERLDLTCPGQHVPSGLGAAAMTEYLPAAIGAPPGVDGDHDALAAEFFRRLGDECGAGQRGRVDAAFIGAGEQQAAHVRGAADAAADGEWEKDSFRGAGNDIENGVAILMAGGDVEEGKFIGTGGVIDRRLLDRVTGIAQIDEVDAFDDAAVLDVQAGDDAGFEQGILRGVWRVAGDRIC